MKNQWMLFYREVDLAYFLFNGVWPIAIKPHDEPWGKINPTETREKQVENTERDIPMLLEILKGNKRIFKIDQKRFVIVVRGEFLKD